MSTFKIPNSQGQIRQSNDGDISGEIIESFGLDMSSSKGKIKVSDRLVKVLDYSDDLGGTATTICDIVTFGNDFIVLTEDEAFSCNTNQDTTDPNNWSELASIADMDKNSVGILFDNDLLISLDTDINLWDGSTSDTNWWTTVASGPTLTTDFPHVLDVVQSQKETLYVTDATEVHYLELGGTVKTVTLDGNVTANCLAGGLSGAMWVGSFNENGNCYVYEIYTGEVVGSTAVYRQAYEIDAKAVLAIWMYDNTPYIITSRGDVQAFNGVAFATVAEFPFKFSSEDLEGIQWGAIDLDNHQRGIHPRGVKMHNNSTFININTKSDSNTFSIDTRSHSGVWEFDHSTGQLVHRFPFSHTDNDFGTSSQVFAYPIFIVNNQYTFLMAGGHEDIFETKSENVYMTDPASSGQGYFITPEIESGTIEDTYEVVYHKAKTLALNEEVVTQYRITKRDTVYGTVNWLNDSSFTTTDDWSTVALGDLVRISHGYSAGEYANVTSIKASAATYTVEISRAVGSTAEVSYVYSDNFKQLGRDPDVPSSYDENATYTIENGEYKKVGVGETTPWIQYMVIMTGDIEYRQFISKGNAKTEL